MCRSPDRNLGRYFSYLARQIPDLPRPDENL